MEEHKIIKDLELNQHPNPQPSIPTNILTLSQKSSYKPEDSFTNPLEIINLQNPQSNSSKQSKNPDLSNTAEFGNLECTLQHPSRPESPLKILKKHTKSFSILNTPTSKFNDTNISSFCERYISQLRHKAQDDSSDQGIGGKSGDSFSRWCNEGRMQKAILSAMVLKKFVKENPVMEKVIKEYVFE